MGYKTQSSDTHPVVERLQFERLRQMGRQARFEQGLARIDESLTLMWRALRRLHPNATAEEMHIEWVRVQFGEELAQRVADYLQCQTPANIEKPFAAP